MNPTVSVILPTHAPHPGRFARTLGGLRRQTLGPRDWQLVVVDNASPDPKVFAGADLGWHPRAAVVREERLGLTHARLAGIRAAVADFLILVDDDNVLDPNYLEETARVFAERPRVGVIGGKCVPEWEEEPADWVGEFASCLALRDLGDEERTYAHAGPKAYPDFAPLGAGMALRRAVAGEYARSVEDGSRAPLPDRCGQQTTSGGDNDIVLTALAAGWEVGYFPRLRLTHLIPAGRLTRDYLARLNHGIARSWVQVLDRHGIRPWPAVPPWSVPLRKLRAYWRCRAWRGPAAYVRWRGACGMFEGRATLPQC